MAAGIDRLGGNAQPVYGYDAFKHRVALAVPHIYSSDSSAYYHAYGLAELALEQWREYFYEKYGYIVDNPSVGKEMREVWRLGSLKNFGEFVKLATGKQLSADAYIKDATMDADAFIARGKERIARLDRKSVV